MVCQQLSPVVSDLGSPCFSELDPQMELKRNQETIFVPILLGWFHVLYFPSGHIGRGLGSRELRMGSSGKKHFVFK